MNFALTALAERPQALYMLDDDSPFQDYSSYNRTGTVSGGTPTKHVSLANGAQYSQVFNKTIIGAFATPVFVQGKESQPFSLEAIVRPILAATNTEQQILGNQNQLDGLTINGTVVSFVTKYVDGSEARASYDLQHVRRAHIVGTHTEQKNTLFVDNQLVSEVQITDAQRASTYVATSASLYSGATTGSQSIALNGLAIYDHALPAAAVRENYLAGHRSGDVPTQFGGDLIPVSDKNATLFMTSTWNKAEDWQKGQAQNVDLTGDELRPQFSGESSLNGYWLDSFVLAAANTTSIYGVVMDWNGIGIDVSVSLDGTTWVAATRRQKLSLVPAGYNPTDKQLQIKVTFAGGITNDTAFLDDLKIVGILSGTTPAVAGRTITHNNSVPNSDHDPMALHDGWGAHVPAGGTLVLSADTVQSLPARTLEVWVKRTSTTAPTFSISGTTYHNGAVSAGSLVEGQWTLMHIVASADVTGSITITGPAQVGHLAVYETALSAATISSIYAAYVGTNAQRIGDNSVITVTQVTNAASVYGYDWSILGAG